MKTDPPSLAEKTDRTPLQREVQREVQVKESPNESLPKDLKEPGEDTLLSAPSPADRGELDLDERLARLERIVSRLDNRLERLEGGRPKAETGLDERWLGKAGRALLLWAIVVIAFLTAYHLFGKQ